MAQESTKEEAPEPKETPSASQEQEAVKSPAQPSSGGGGKTALVIVIVVLVVIVALGAVGYYFVRKAVKKVADVNNLGSTFNIGDTKVTTGEDQKWPSGLPSDVPQFTAGKIQGTSKVGDTTTIIVAEVKDADVTNYKKALTDKGWTVNSETDVEGISAYDATKSGYTVSVIFTAAEGSALVNIGKATS